MDQWRELNSLLWTLSYENHAQLKKLAPVLGRDSLMEKTFFLNQESWKSSPWA